MKNTSSASRKGDRNSQAATDSRNPSFTVHLLQSRGSGAAVFPGKLAGGLYFSATAVKDGVQFLLRFIQRSLDITLAIHDGTEGIVEGVHVVGTDGAELEAQNLTVTGVLENDEVRRGLGVVFAEVRVVGQCFAARNCQS